MSIHRFEQFLPQISPSAWIHPDSTLIGDVHVADEATIWPGAVLRGDQGPIRIGARTSIQDGCVVHATEGTSETHIGEGCTVGHRAILHGCRVGATCLVGMGSVVMDNVQVGDGSFIAAGSLLTPNKVFPPGSFILGSPARRVREVSVEERNWMEASWKIYVDLAQRHRASR